MPLYEYQGQKNSDYQVVLKPNDFYITPFLPSGLYYVSKSIDSFNLNYKYDFKAKEKANIEYNYAVTANLVGNTTTNDNQSKEVWNRTYNLIGDNSNNQNDVDGFTINQDVNIDYEEYNKLTRLFEQTYSVAIDATLKVYLNVNIKIILPDSNETPQLIEDCIELDIPVNSTVTEVKENYEKSIYNNIMSETRRVSIKEIAYYVIGALFILGAITIAVIVIKKRKNSKTLQDMYETNIKHILKYYSDLIVTVSNEPDLTNLQIMNVPLFNDIIDVAEQNKCNIIHYEELKKRQSTLYVIVGKYAYKYVVLADEN